MINNLSEPSLTVQSKGNNYDFLMSDGQTKTPNNYSIVEYGNYSHFASVDVYWNRIGNYITAIFKFNVQSAISGESGFGAIFGGNPISGPKLPKPVFSTASSTYNNKTYGLIQSQDNLNTYTNKRYGEMLVNTGGTTYLENTMKSYQTSIPVGIYFLEMNYICQN